MTILIIALKKYVEVIFGFQQIIKYYSTWVNIILPVYFEKLFAFAISAVRDGDDQQLPL